ncbi:MAG TPA: hypothetical protein VK213_11840, partial [Bacteroidales bacterium]|nr:hypothetical protein [Bacteroidales bacterium]
RGRAFSLLSTPLRITVSEANCNPQSGDHYLEAWQGFSLLSTPLRITVSEANCYPQSVDLNFEAWQGFFFVKHPPEDHSERSEL